MTTDSAWIGDGIGGKQVSLAMPSNWTIDRDKDASRVCFLIQERMLQVVYPARGNTA